MDAQQIKVLIDAMSASDLAEMEASRDGWTLRLVRRAPARAVAPAPAPSATSSPPAAPAAAHEQHANLSGVVFLQPAPGDPSFVQPGQAVRAGQVLCVIEAMKVFNEVHADRDGTVEAFLVASGQDIDAGQALVRYR